MHTPTRHTRYNGATCPSVAEAAETSTAGQRIYLPLHPTTPTPASVPLWICLRSQPAASELRRNTIARCQRRARTSCSIRAILSQISGCECQWAMFIVAVLEAVLLRASFEQLRRSADTYVVRYVAWIKRVRQYKVFVTTS